VIFGLEYIFELVPSRRSDVDRIISVSHGFFKYYTIPEAPGGYPGIFSLATALYVKMRFEEGAIAHVRLYDINRLALLSIANAVREYDVDGLLLLRGDKPWKGGIVEDIGSEDALRLLRRKGYGFPKGLLLSLNYNMEEIMERLNLTADFYYILNYYPERRSMLGEVWKTASRQGSKVYVFILLGIGRNKELFRKLGQPYVEARNLKDILHDISGAADGVILSSPLEPVEGIRLLIHHAV
jgi:5,10-methylenetetrahydrofolate reductase